MSKLIKILGKLIKIIECIVFTAMMYAVPILFTCSICLNWNAFVKLWLSLSVGLQIIAVYFYVMVKVYENDV